MSQVRVLLLFSHLHKGGMERVASNLSRALPTAWKQYLGYFGTEHPEFEFRASAVDFGIPGGREVGSARKFFSFVRRFNAVRRFVQSEAIDLVISFGEAANVINLAARHAAKTLITVHTPVRRYLDGEGRWGRIYGYAVRHLYPRADLLVAVSAGIVSQLERDFAYCGRSRVIPNLYHRSEIEALARVELPPEYQTIFDHPVILNVGSLGPEKGQDDLLRAFALVRRSLAELRLVILGRGPLRASLEALARDLSISEHVYFVDFDPNPYRYMSRAAVFVLTSHFEGFANVLVESMLCGTPVISVDCEFGPREILEDGKWGILVAGRSPEAIAQSIMAVAQDDVMRRRYADLAKARAAAYEADQIVPLWEQAVRQLLVEASVPGSGACS